MSKSEITYSVEDVSPALADEWLKTMIENRPLRETRVFKYARDMEAGRWVQSAQPIKFDTHGSLIDGQHRLQAVTLARKTVKMEVARNVPASAVAVLDEGGPRTPADVLAIMGSRYSMDLASALSTAWRVLSGQLYAGGRALPSRQELLRLNAAIGEELVEIIKMIRDGENFSGAKTRRNYLPAGALAGLAFCFRRASMGKADAFVQACDSWLQLPNDHPVVALQTRLLNEKTRRVKTVDQQGRYALIVRAWNSFYQVKTSKRTLAGRMVDGSMSFPLIAGLDIDKVAPEISSIFRSYKSDGIAKALATASSTKAGVNRRDRARKSAAS